MFVRILTLLALLVAAHPAGAEERAFDLTVSKAALAEPAVLKAEEGDRVILKIRPELDGLLHLHGYGHALPLKSGVVTTLDFTAQYSGRFPAELHGEQTRGHAVVFYLEVYPK